MNKDFSPTYVKLQGNRISFVTKDQVLINPNISLENALQKYQIEKIIPHKNIIDDMKAQQKIGLKPSIQFKQHENHSKISDENDQRMNALSQVKEIRDNFKPQDILQKNLHPQIHQIKIQQPKQSIISPSNSVIQSKKASIQISSINKEKNQVPEKKNEFLPQASKKQKVKNIQQTKLQIQIKAQRSIFRVKQEAQIPAMITFKANNGVRTSLDVICVIDNSGSMDGRKIELAKNAIKYIIDSLQENDRLCIVTFNNNATQLSKLDFLSGENKQIFYNVIKDIDARGGTNISSGLDLALKILRERTFINEVTSIFLLSDGQNKKIYQCPKKKFQRDIESPENKIIGSFTLHSFGIGEGHDQTLMNGLSLLKDGTFYYIKQLKTIDQAFCNALGSIIAIVAQNIKIYFNVVSKGKTEGIKISKTFGKIQKFSNKMQEYLIKLCSIGAGMRKDFVFKLKIPFIQSVVNDFQRNHQIIKVSFSANKPNGQVIMGGCSLNITLVNYDQNIPDFIESIDVIENYLRAKTAQKIQESIMLADNKKYENAKDVLNKMVDQILSNKKARYDKKNLLISDLKSIKQKCDEQYWETQGRKTGTYLMSAHCTQTSYHYQSDMQYQMSSSLLNSKKGTI